MSNYNLSRDLACYQTTGMPTSVRFAQTISEKNEIEINLRLNFFYKNRLWCDPVYNNSAKFVFTPVKSGMRNCVTVLAVL